MDESSILKNRRSRRSPVLLAGTIEVAGKAVQVRVRNLSEEGALIESERLPVEGSTTVFERNDLRRQSRVVWVHGRFAGLAFDAPLNPEEALRHIPKPRAKAPVDCRRPSLACRPLTAYERRMLETWMTSSPVGTLGTD